jgi:CheY-like chemotaxis protein
MSRAILLVEDDINDAFLFERAFGKAQSAAALRIVRDGEKVVDYLTGKGEYGDRTRYPFPALILLDLKLPRRGGLEVLAWIRQHERFRRLPVVILTSSKQSFDIERAYDLGANSYIVKPMGVEELIQLVQVLNHYWLGLNQHPSIPVA